MVVTALACLWIAGLAGYINLMPSAPHLPGYKTDAIIVLTGGQGRIAEAMALYIKGEAKHLFVSGVDKSIRLEDIKRMNRIALPGNREHSIHLGYAASSTFGNADESRDWIEKNDINSIRLVTSAYHMPRAMMIFYRTMPTLTIIPHPVIHEDFSYNGWWMNWKPLSTVISEYHKYIGFIIMHPFGMTW